MPVGGDEKMRGCAEARLIRSYLEAIPTPEEGESGNGDTGDGYVLAVDVGGAEFGCISDTALMRRQIVSGVSRPSELMDATGPYAAIQIRK